MSSLQSYTRQEFHKNSPLEELLLASDTKQAEEPFDFYITPYTNKDSIEDIEEHSLNKSEKEENPSSKPEDITILRFHEREASTQLFSKPEQDSSRLKQIIMKKNQIIGQLTQEIMNLKAKVHKKKCNTVDKNLSKHIDFLQKNNTQLFEQLSKVRKEKEEIQVELTKIKEKVIPRYQLEIKTLQHQNQLLKTENLGLMKDIKDYLKKGKKQMKYISKIKDMLFQPSVLKELSQVQLSIKECSRMSAFKDNTFQMTPSLPSKHNKIIKSQEMIKSGRTSRGDKETRPSRCYSISKFSKFD